MGFPSLRRSGISLRISKIDLRTVPNGTSAPQLRQLQPDLPAGDHFRPRPNYLTKLTTQQIRAFLNKLAQQKVKRTGKPMSARRVRNCRSVLAITVGLRSGELLGTMLELLGHSQMAMTSDLYARIVEELKREASGP